MSYRSKQSSARVEVDDSTGNWSRNTSEVKRYEAGLESKKSDFDNLLQYINTSKLTASKKFGNFRSIFFLYIFQNVYLKE